MNNFRTRAAEYVRMSTEHQKYSNENQRDVIREYAEKHNMDIVRSYADDGKAVCALRGVMHLNGLLKMLIKATLILIIFLFMTLADGVVFRMLMRVPIMNTSVNKQDSLSSIVRNSLKTMVVPLRILLKM